MKPYFNNFSVMGTRFDFLVPCPYPDDIEEIFMEVRLQLLSFDNLFNKYEPQSEISFINNHAFQSEIEISPSLLEIIKTAIYYSELTHGAFDITLNKESEFHVKEGWKSVYLDENKETVKFSKKLNLDLGGMAKGYVLDKIKIMLKSFGLTDVFISFGESSVLGMGKHPHGNNWRTGIQNVFHPQELIHEIELNDEALSTSGLAWNKVNGKRYPVSHIVNPFILNKPFENKTITVRSGDPSIAEVLSTAIYVMEDENEIINLVRNMNAYVIKVTYNHDQTYQKREYYK